MTATVEQIRARYPQTRGMGDETIHARAADMTAALRSRYGVTRSDAAAAAALAQTVLIYFGWWLLYVDQIASESANTTGASTTHGAPAWPVGIIDMLAAVSDAPPAHVTQLVR